jgi:hypothetical protein
MLLHTMSGIFKAEDEGFGGGRHERFKGSKVSRFEMFFQWAILATEFGETLKL